jgi:hypothetical protein
MMAGGRSGRAGEAFVDHDLRRAQHALFLALGIGHALLVAFLAAMKMGFIMVPEA